MENAARSAVEIIEQHHRSDGTSATIVCGGGNNGGDGYAIARLLHNRGWQITIVALKPIDQLTGDAAVMANVISKMRAVTITSDLAVAGREKGLLIDAITGTGLTKPLHGVMADAVRAVNATGRPIIAIDVPSGLDCDTGEPLGECVRAARTISFVAEKLGFADQRSREFTGDISIGDIGCPREVIADVA